MTNIKLILFSLALSSGILFAQNYECDILPAFKSKARHAYYKGIDSEGFIYTYSRNEYIKVFDPKTGVIISEKKGGDISELSEMGYSFESFEVVGDLPVIVCNKDAKPEGKSTYHVNLNQKLELISDPYLVIEREECEKLIGSEYVGSHDLFRDEESGMVMHLTSKPCKSEETSFFSAILNDSQGNLLKEFSFNLDFQSAQLVDLTMYDQETYFLTFKGTNKESVEGKLLKRWDTSNQLVRLDDRGGVKKVDLDILDEEFYCGELRTVKSNNKLLVLGKIMEKAYPKFEGVFSGVIHPNSTEVSDVNIKFFEKEFVVKYWSDKAKAEREHGGYSDYGGEEGYRGNYKLVHSFSTSDGGGVYFFQDYSILTIENDTKVTNYHVYDDLLAIKLNSTGKIDWMHYFPMYESFVKHHNSPRSPSGRGFTVTKKDGQIVILYEGTTQTCEMIKKGKSVELKRKKGESLYNTYIIKINDEGEVQIGPIVISKEQGKFTIPFIVGVDNSNSRFISVSSIKNKISRIVYIDF